MTENPTKVWLIKSKQTEAIELADLSSLDAITRQLPDGYYSTFRTYGQGTRVIGLKAHLQRLFQPVPNGDVTEIFYRQSLRVLLMDFTNEARARIIMTKAGQAYIAIEPLKILPREVCENGVKTETTDIGRNTPRLKTTAFIGVSEGERKHIAAEGVFEALLVKNGKITEGMTSNFFYVIGSEIFTAQRDILLGVTRQTVIRAARGIGLTVHYQPLERDQIKRVDEAFITSSSRGIVPVVQIDAVTVGEGKPGRITQQLSAAYEAYVLKKAENI
jgi:branched-chain amino acid aminotransferase